MYHGIIEREIKNYFTSTTTELLKGWRSVRQFGSALVALPGQGQRRAGGAHEQAQQQLGRELADDAGAHKKLRYRPNGNRCVNSIVATTVSIDAHPIIRIVLVLVLIILVMRGAGGARICTVRHRCGAAAGATDERVAFSNLLVVGPHLFLTFAMVEGLWLLS